MASKVTFHDDWFSAVFALINLNCKNNDFSAFALLFLLFYPFSYPSLSVEFHHSENAESDGDGGLKGCETRMEGIGKMVGDDVVTCPKDTRTRH